MANSANFGDQSAKSLFTMKGKIMTSILTGKVKRPIERPALCQLESPNDWE